MKSLLLLITVLTFASFTTPAGEGISDAERKMAVSEFQRTKERFLKDVQGLTPQQLSFKADSSRWSIAQCIEHIALAEGMIWQWFQMTESQPATPEKAAEVKVTNEQLMQSVVDRSKTFKAPEMLQPSGKFASTADALKAYTARRDSTIQYISTTKDDLKNHITQHPAFGSMNTYQMLLLLSGHSERHTLQIEEVKTSAGYPK